MSTYTATSKAADAPDISEFVGVRDFRFDGDEATISKGGKYQKNPEGDPKLLWNFTALDDDGDPLYVEGDPIEVQVMTGVGFNIASKTVPAEVKMLKVLATKEEFQAFLDGKGIKGEKLVGRIVQGELFVKESGWPGVTNIIPARKAKAARPAPAAAEAVDED
jgi:hypothetical protein